MNWAHLMDSQTTEIKVSVIGDLGAYTFLSEYCKNKQIAGKTIVIDKSNDITTVHKSNVVYIGQNYKNSKYILRSCLGKPVLTICNMRHTTNDGAVISFYANNDGKVVIEVSERNCKKNNVMLSSKLLNLATMVP